jgi:hypothetical protein
MVEGYAMKALVDTLQVALVSPHLPSAAPPLLMSTASPQMIMPPPEFMMKVEERAVLADEQTATTPTSTAGNEQESLASLLGIDEEARPTKKTPPPRGNNKALFNDELSKYAMSEIQTAMNAQDIVGVHSGVKEAASNPEIKLMRKFLHNCFQFMTPLNPLYAYDIMAIYHDFYTADAAMYVRICNSISLLTVRHGPSVKSKSVITNLLEEIQERLTPEERQRALPLLLRSIGKTSLGSVRGKSKFVYDVICEDDAVELRPGDLEHILRNSKFWSDEKLPYHELIQLFAESGGIPRKAHSLANALTNMFPYTDTAQMLTAVEGLHQIVKNCQESDDPVTNNILQIDMGALEQIMAGAARKGSHELGLATWDLCESLGYRPTELFYECMIQAFAMGYRQDLALFACLADMEDSGGFTPSRSVIRSISRSLRFSVNRCDNAYRCIMNQYSGCRPTLASLNAIMSACAELGEVDRTFSVLLDDFPKQYIKAEPNQDSFAFAMESLAVAAQTDSDQQAEKEENTEIPSDREGYDARRVTRLEAAEQVLNLMEERDLEISSSVFHEYIRVLINSDELEVATLAAIDAKDTSSFDVANKTLMYLVNRHTLADGDFDVAKGLVGRMTESFHFLYRRIEKRERRKNERLAGVAAVGDDRSTHGFTSAESLSKSDADDDMVDDEGETDESTAREETEPVVV